MTAAELALVFGLGLASGLHCLQMCGPIVLAYSLPLGRGEACRAHFLYNSGRITTYTLLGALAGLLGGGIGLAGRLAGMASGARMTAGAAMIVAGILMAGSGPSSALVAIGSGGTRARLSRVVSRLLLSRRKFRLGLALGLLPCGLIYAALLKAVDTASAGAGALTMLAFGLGTAVALGALGAGASFAGAHLGRWSYRLAPLGVMAAGVILVWRGFAGTHCHG